MHVNIKQQIGHDCLRKLINSVYCKLYMTSIPDLENIQRENSESMTVAGHSWVEVGPPSLPGKSEISCTCRNVEQSIVTSLASPADTQNRHHIWLHRQNIILGNILKFDFLMLSSTGR